MANLINGLVRIFSPNIYSALILYDFFEMHDFLCEVQKIFLHNKNFNSPQFSITGSPIEQFLTSIIVVLFASDCIPPFPRPSSPDLPPAPHPPQQA
jgi:hypothetical protein